MALDELTKADNGNYTCVVCNELGCIEHTVVLHVQGKVQFKLPYFPHWDYFWIDNVIGNYIYMIKLGNFAG